MEDLLGLPWGEQLLSKYYIIKCIHRSQMGEVYLLETRDGQTHSTLKVVNREIINTDAIAAISQLNSKHIATIMDFHVSEKYVYLIKPYIEGNTLTQAIEEGISLGVALSIVKQILGLVALCHGHHPPIILRDIKPDNIILQKGQVLLLDVEASKLVGNQTLGRDTVLLGTPGFAAPEQYGYHTSNERTDIFAIGQVMLALIGPKSAGKKSINPLRQFMIYRYQSIAKKAVAFDPNQRYSDVEAFKRRIVRLPYLMGGIIGIPFFLILSFSVLILTQHAPEIIVKAEIGTEGYAQVNKELIIESVSETTFGTEPESKPETKPETKLETQPETTPLTKVPTTTPAAKPTTTETPQNFTITTTAPSETSKASDSTQTLIPGVEAKINASLNSLKVYVSRSALEPSLQTFNRFTVLSTDVSPSRAKEFLYDFNQTGNLKGFQEVSDRDENVVFFSMSDYADRYMVIFSKDQTLLGFVYIINGKPEVYELYQN